MEISNKFIWITVGKGAIQQPTDFMRFIQIADSEGMSAQGNLVESFDTKARKGDALTWFGVAEPLPGKVPQLSIDSIIFEDAEGKPILEVFGKNGVTSTTVPSNLQGDYKYSINVTYFGSDGKPRKGVIDPVVTIPPEEDDDDN